MSDYTPLELNEALRAINSVIHKCEKAQEKFPEGNSHHTLLRNRLKAMYISKALILDKLSNMEPALNPMLPVNEEYDVKELLSHIDALHTTDLGAQRIQKNLNLCTEDVISWCKEKVAAPGALISRKGKNWYITADCCEITVNARSYTIITAHRKG